MLNLSFLNKFSEKTLTRDHTFFANPHRHKKWSEDKQNLDISKITDLNLECIGYGEFHIVSII
jgi:hypothetical protein